MTKTALIVLAGIALIIGSIVYVAHAASTDIQKTTLQNQIRTSLIAGIVPAIDLSQVSPDDFTAAYIQVAKDDGVDFQAASKAKDYNIYRLIRNVEVKKGTKILPSTNAKADTANTAMEFN